MQKEYIKRNVENLLLETFSDTPVTVLQGARQVGKSTLLSMISNSIDAKSITLDDPDVLLSAKSDPKGFVDQYSSGTLIIDEIQLLPSLLRTIKLSVDNKRRPGKFILTGSADLLHISGANESLAGRAETVTLYPFSRGEIEGHKEDFITSILNSDVSLLNKEIPQMSRKQYADLVAIGGYPDAITRDDRRRNAYFKNYKASVIDHDAVEISGLAHLDKLGDVLSILSAQTSGELVNANIAKMTQIPERSIHAYIKLLENLCLLNTIPAWGRNLTKRSIGRKKISIIDTGFASSINRITGEMLSDFNNGEVFGALLENFVASEIYKQQTWSETNFSIYHYRDTAMREVDLLIEMFDGRIIALEIKAASSISPKDFRGLKYLKEKIGDKFLKGFVLYTGNETLSFGDDIYCAPINIIWSK